MFKKKLALIVGAASLLLVGCGTASNEEAASSTKASSEETLWSAIEEEGVMQVAVSGTLFPSNYHGDDNELTGYEVEVVNEIGERLGVDIEYVEMGTDGIMTAVQNGQVDMAANSLQVTDNRLEDYNFTEPIMYSFGGAVVRESDDSDIYALEDWEGKKAAGGATTTWMTIAESLGAEPIVYDNATNDIYFRDVASGRTDFIPNNYHISNTSVQTYSDLGVKMSDVKYNPTTVAFTLNKQDTSVKEKIDPIIQDLHEEGILTELSKEFYMGEDVSKQIDNVDELPIVEVAE